MWLQFWLGSLELLALLLAATVHDVDHPGTTNTFQTNTKWVINECLYKCYSFATGQI